MDIFLAQTREYWYQDFMRSRVRAHALLCSRDCARAVVHDGSGKVYRHGCPEELDPVVFNHVSVRKMRGLSYCTARGRSVHGRTATATTPPNMPDVGHTCHTLKEKHHREARESTCGCMGSSFVCGTLGPFHAPAFSESRSQL